MELQNCCVCCSLAEDLVASISNLVQLAEMKKSPYDHIIVECSGIAEPRRIREFFQQAEDYGLITSIRVWYIDGREIEYGITDERWAAIPLDEGSRRVISDGMQVLFEQNHILSRHQ